MTQLTIERNPMNYTCAPNRADPTYASEHDIEKFVAYGLLVCHYDLQEGIFSRHDLVDDDHIRELREAFLCCVEDTILYFWTGDVEIGQTDFDLGDALSTNVGNSEEGDNEEFMFQWIPHRVTEECFVFDLHCSVLVGEGTGGEPTTLFLDMEAIQDREKVREVFRKAREINKYPYRTNYQEQQNDDYWQRVLS